MTTRRQNEPGFYRETRFVQLLGYPVPYCESTPQPAF